MNRCVSILKKTHIPAYTKEMRDITKGGIQIITKAGME